jgi:CHASE1-domain containing sensor protein
MFFIGLVVFVGIVAIAVFCLLTLFMVVLLATRHIASIPLSQGIERLLSQLEGRVEDKNGKMVFPEDFV